MFLLPWLRFNQIPARAAPDQESLCPSVAAIDFGSSAPLYICTFARHPMHKPALEFLCKHFRPNFAWLASFPSFVPPPPSTLNPRLSLSCATARSPRWNGGHFSSEPLRSAAEPVSPIPDCPLKLVTPGKGKVLAIRSVYLRSMCEILKVFELSAALTASLEKK